MTLRLGYSLATLVPGFVGGTESYARGVLAGLSGLDAGDVRVRVIANAAAAPSLEPAVGSGVELVVAPGRFERSQPERLASMVRLRLDARRLAPQLADGLDVMHHAVTVPLPHVFGMPTVLTLQDVQHREHPEWQSRAELLYRRVAYDAAARRATRVITATEHARGQIAEHLGIAPERIDVIPHGIAHERFSPAPVGGDAETLAGLPLPARFVFYPANLWPHKNHERLVAGLARTTDPDVGLVLTGQSYGRLEALLERARALGVGRRVTHLGHVPGAALPALYRRAAGMVFPSLFEGFGIPLIEAMACGCPVAASSTTSLPEVCGDAAAYFDPLSPEDMARAVDDVLERPERYVERGLQRARLFTWDECARRHDAVYRELAARP